MNSVCIIEQNKAELLAIKHCIIEIGIPPISFHNNILLSTSALDQSYVAIISLNQDVGNGLRLAKSIKKTHPQIRIILTSAIDITPFEDRILTVVDVLLLRPYGRTELQCLITSLMARC